MVSAPRQQARDATTDAALLPEAALQCPESFCRLKNAKLHQPEHFIMLCLAQTLSNITLVILS